MGDKFCYRCGQTKTLENFYKKTKNSYSSPCKSCKVELANAWKENNLEKVKEIKKKYYTKIKV